MTREKLCLNVVRPDDDRAPKVRVVFVLNLLSLLHNRLVGALLGLSLVLLSSPVKKSYSEALLLRLLLFRSLLSLALEDEGLLSRRNDARRVRLGADLVAGLGLSVRNLALGCGCGNRKLFPRRLVLRPFGPRAFAPVLRRKGF